jgi:hypothetical protein
LIPSARNARTHSPKQVEQLANSIREFGWTMPMLVDEKDNLIAGHGRLLAAHSLGYTDGPVMVARGWSEAQKRAYMLADNKLPMNAGWDKDLLRMEVTDLLSLSPANLGLTGFDVGELQSIVFPGGAEKTGASGLKNGLTYQVVVECDDEQQQADIIEELRERQIKCKPMIL